MRPVYRNRLPSNNHVDDKPARAFNASGELELRGEARGRSAQA